MKLVLDTNFYLHYIRFDQCNWIEFLGEDQITLLVTPTILAELDEKKRDQRDHISKRARQLTLMLDDIYEGKTANPLKCGIYVEVVYPIDTSKIDWEGFRLNKSSNDDMILAEILSLKNENEDLIFVTADRISRMKAIAIGITTKIAPHEWMRDVKDSRDKKILALEEEIKRLKKASLPKVDLYLDNNGDFRDSLQIPVGIDLSFPKDINIDDILSLFRDEYDNELREMRSRINRGPIIDIYSISSDDLKRYEKRVDKYLIEIKDFLCSMLEYSTYVIRIPLILANVGEVPAEDVDVHIIIPKDLLVQDPPTNLNPPTKPEKLNMYNIAPIPKSDILNIYDILKEKSERGPLVNKSDNEVKYWINSLKHNLVKPITIFVKFLQGNNPHIFQLKYVINIGNHPEVISGSLEVIPFDNIIQNP